MTCREIVEFLVDYKEGNLPADVKARFERHLELCPPCVAYLNTYNSVSELAQDAICGECCDVPEELVQAILAARKEKKS